jgi:hypothetical protein
MKHDADFLINRYAELNIKQKTADRWMAMIYRDEMRKIKKILQEKYKITLDK